MAEVKKKSFNSSKSKIALISIVLLALFFYGIFFIINRTTGNILSDSAEAELKVVLEELGFNSSEKDNRKIFIYESDKGESGILSYDNIGVNPATTSLTIYNPKFEDDSSSKIEFESITLSSTFYQIIDLIKQISSEDISSLSLMEFDISFDGASLITDSSDLELEISFC